MIECRVACDRCERTLIVADVSASGEVRCECGVKHPTSPSAVLGDRLTGCAFCGTPDLYWQKDFPERLGVVIAATGAISATIAYAAYATPWTWTILFSFAAVDFLLYRYCGTVIVCYRCAAQFRGADAEASGIKTFDLGINERYRQEKLRRDQLRSQNRVE